jgi:hypothetical protein
MVGFAKGERKLEVVAEYGGVSDGLFLADLQPSNLGDRFR